MSGAGNTSPSATGLGNAGELVLVFFRHSASAETMASSPVLVQMGLELVEMPLGSSSETSSSGLSGSRPA